MINTYGREQLVLAQDYLQIIITGANHKKEVFSIRSLLDYFRIFTAPFPRGQVNLVKGYLSIYQAKADKFSYIVRSYI